MSGRNCRGCGLTHKKTYAHRHIVEAYNERKEEEQAPEDLSDERLSYKNLPHSMSVCCVDEFSKFLAVPAQQSFPEVGAEILRAVAVVVVSFSASGFGVWSALAFHAFSAWMLL